VQRAGPIDRITLLNITIFVEAFILLTATFWTRIAGIDLMPFFDPQPMFFLFGIAGGLTLAAFSFTALWLGRNTGMFSDLREITFTQIAPIFNTLQPIDLLLVAAMSGFCEEVFFRGAMQSQLGIFATSIIFALFHCPNFRFISYGVWVFIAGSFLGWLYFQTQSLWVPILAHALSNCISLFFLRYAVKIPPSPSE
jgi:membrane protease YdiL (CAAX protease family)